MLQAFLVLPILLNAPISEAVDRALERVEPPPSLRASFQATISSDKAYRTLSYDPFNENGGFLRVLSKSGTSEELDSIIDAWQSEGQADARLFADDLAMSLAEASLRETNGVLRVNFRHKISPNDGPVDVMVSSHVVGQLYLSPGSDRLSAVDYKIDRPIKLDDGTRITEYRQTYRFGYSEKWDTSYVAQYDLNARGGKWGIQEGRHIKVVIDKVEFQMAGDARQELNSRVSLGFGYRR